jgi:hypothetical protein
VKHLQERSNFRFLSVRLYNVASIAAIPLENDHPADFLISKIPAYEGVKKSHGHVLLG